MRLFFVKALLVAIGIQGALAEDSKCKSPLAINPQGNCVLGWKNVTLELGRADGLIGDAYIQVIVPSDGHSAQFSFGVDIPVDSWLFVQRADGTYRVSGMESLDAARAFWVNPGEKAWFQVRLIGWESMKKDDTKNLLFWSGLTADPDVLLELAKPTLVTVSIKKTE